MTPIGFIKLLDAYCQKRAEGAGCLEFALLLFERFPNCHLYYNHEHIIVWCEGNYWDYEGRVNPHKVKMETYTTIESYGYETIKHQFKPSFQFNKLLRKYFKL